MYTTTIDIGTKQELKRELNIVLHYNRYMYRKKLRIHNRLYKDEIKHYALTILPVLDGQINFPNSHNLLK